MDDDPYYFARDSVHVRLLDAEDHLQDWRQLLLSPATGRPNNGHAGAPFSPADSDAAALADLRGEVSQLNHSVEELGVAVKAAEGMVNNPNFPHIDAIELNTRATFLRDARRRIRCIESTISRTLEHRAPTVTTASASGTATATATHAAVAVAADITDTATDSVATAVSTNNKMSKGSVAIDVNLKAFREKSHFGWDSDDNENASLMGGGGSDGKANGRDNLFGVRGNGATKGGRGRREGRDDHAAAAMRMSLVQMEMEQNDHLSLMADTLKRIG